MNTEKSLISIVNESVSIENMLIESGGEMTPEIESALIVNEKTLAEKLDGYFMVIERFEALETHYQSRADFFKTVSVQCKNAAKRLKDNIKFAMEELGVQEIRGQDVRFKLMQSAGALTIDDADMVPVEFKTEVVTTEIDKKKLKEALVKAEIPGAKLTYGSFVRSFANMPEKKSKKAVSNV